LPHSTGAPILQAISCRIVLEYRWALVVFQVPFPSTASYILIFPFTFRLKFSYLSRFTLFFIATHFLPYFPSFFFKGIVHSITLTVKCFLSPVKLILNRLNRFCERSEVPFHECTIRTFEKKNTDLFLYSILLKVKSFIGVI
jgi:hypothetical protein